MRSSEVFLTVLLLRAGGGLCMNMVVDTDIIRDCDKLIQCYDDELRELARTCGIHCTDDVLYSKMSSGGFFAVA